MAKTTRRTFSTEDKQEFVRQFESQNNETRIPAQQFAMESNLAPSLFRRWLKEFGGKSYNHRTAARTAKSLPIKNRSPQSVDQDDDADGLHLRIGQLQTDNDLLQEEIARLQQKVLALKQAIKALADE